MLFIYLAYSKSYLPNFLLGYCYICDISIHHKENKQAELPDRVDSGAELVPDQVDPIPHKMSRVMRKSAVTMLEARKTLQ